MTKIAWTEEDGRAQGALKTAAHRMGIAIHEYLRRRMAGEKHCRLCREWMPLARFSIDRSRGDGRVAACRQCVSAAARAGYIQRPHVARRGRRLVKARDDDRKQARRRVNHLVDLGLLPRPNSVPCVDCGHEWQEGTRRHEYDHHYGYLAEHHEHVEAVCTTCHRQREKARR